MYPSDWPKCRHCENYALDGKATCGNSTCCIKEQEDRNALADLKAAIVFAQSAGDPVAGLQAVNDYVAKNHPLPRCDHGNALRDHGGELLYPSCGCVMAS